MQSIGKLVASQAAYYTEQLRHSVGRMSRYCGATGGLTRWTTTPHTNHRLAGWARGWIEWVSNRGAQWR